MAWTAIIPPFAQNAQDGAPDSVIRKRWATRLCSEPERKTLADAIHYLKLSFAKRVRPKKEASESAPFWQKRYFDRNVRNAREFGVKLRYLHRNPMKRGLVKQPHDWKWSSFRHYALREIGAVEVESQWTASDRETKLLGGVPRVFLNPG